MKDLVQRATGAEEQRADVPRSLFILAHPDDETVAFGGRLGRFHTAHFVHVTDGAPRDGQDSRAHGFDSPAGYRRARFEELDEALRAAGLSHVSRQCLDIPDQEASLHLHWLAKRIYNLVEQYAPEVVFTHPYEGGHPDHDACAFAVHRAISFLCGDGDIRPVVIEGTFYHAGPSGIETGSFLPHPARTIEVVHSLSAAERENKRQRFACFKTQKQVLDNFQLDSERYRVAPDYDFLQPPHGGRVFYDAFPWGVTSERFSQLAEEALSLQEAESMTTCH